MSSISAHNGKKYIQMISIIMPVYNNSRAELHKAISSIVAQNLEHIEIILVNDASTRKIDLADFGHITLLHHARNKGAAAARNTGMKQAKGEYIALLDADDHWGPNKLGTQLRVLEKAPADTAGVFNPFYYENHPERIYNRQIQCADWFDYFLKGIRVGPGSTLFMRRAVFDRIGPQDTRLPRLEDWDWLLRISQQYSFLHAPNVYSILGHLSRPKQDNLLEECLDKLEEKWCQELPPAALRKFRATLAIERGADALRKGNKTGMVKQVLKAAYLSPTTLHHNLAWKLLKR